VRIAMVNPKRSKKKGSSRKKSRKGGHKKGRSAYQSFVSREMKSLIAKGVAPKSAMKKAASLWRGKTGGVKGHKKGRSNWGTSKGGKKGWDKREAHVRKYKRTRGARYPPKRRGPKMSKAKRRAAALKGIRRRKAKHHRKARANPKHRKSRKHRKAGRRKARHNPARTETLARIDRHVKPHYGNAHMKFMAACLRQRGGRGGMKACASAWKHQASKHGRRQPRFKRRANQGTALATFSSKVEHVTGKLGFPAFREMYPTFEQVKAHKLATFGGVIVGVPSALALGSVFRLAAKDSPVGSEVLGTIGGILGTEIPARAYNRWGKERPGKPTAIKTMRVAGYGTTGAMLILGLVRLASAKKSGKLAGLGDVASKAKDFAKKVAEKAKKAIGVGIFGSEKGMEDVVSSGWDQGYTGYEPLGVSDSLTSKLDARIKALAKDLGLSDAEVTEMMRQEGYDVGYLDYQMAGWGKNDPSIYQMGEYDTYVDNPYADEIGQYGSPSVPLLDDATAPPAERDIFRSDFLV